MPFGAVELRPGVNTQLTLSANQAGVSIAQALRYKDQLLQTLGGWSQYVPFTVPSTVRELHPWQDAVAVKHLGIGATQSLSIITNGAISDVTPQTTATSFSPSFSITAGSCTVTVFDSNSSGVPSVYNSVFFQTPISLAGQILSGAYKVASVLSSISYTLIAANISTGTASSAGTLPIFTTTAGSGSVKVTLPSNGYVSQIGLFYPFIYPTSVGGITVQGSYQVQTILDSTAFTINSPTQATSASTVTMASSLARLVYYVTLGPQPAAGGFGSGGFGSGGFGTGITVTGAPGTPITTTDWTMDNWGEVLLACPKDGPIYTWSPDNGFATAQVITQAPFFNGGIFVSMPQQILVAWRSCQSTGVQDNLRIRWCNSGDYTNWTVSNQTTAGSFELPTGSLIVGGGQVASQGFIWTDVDCWVMQYIGGVLVFGFTRIGSGCGLIAPHAWGTLSGIVYWMGVNNFYIAGADGVVPMPCSVWDFVFQNISQTYVSKVRCATNSAFSEISWFFPSATSTGENDSYVKYNIVEKEWDYGTMSRTAWCDVSILGTPIGADTSGNLYQHEVGNVTVGAGNPSFQSGWWTITEGADLAFVDFVIPDFKFGTYSGSANATMIVTFYSADYADGPITTYGPYNITSSTQYITPRIRGRLMSVKVVGDGVSFFRIGRLRYRFAPAGKR